MDLGLQGDIVINDLGSAAFDSLADSVAAAEARVRSFEQTTNRLKNIQLDNLQLNTTSDSLSGASGFSGLDAGVHREARSEIERAAVGLDNAKDSAREMADALGDSVNRARDLERISRGGFSISPNLPTGILPANVPPSGVSYQPAYSSATSIASLILPPYKANTFAFPPRLS